MTGFGVAEAVDAAASTINLDLVGARVAIQGFGAVGRAAAARLTELGAVVVAVSTATGSVHDPDGLEVAELSAAAREDTIDTATAIRTTARLIVEGANLPTSTAAQQIL